MPPAPLKKRKRAATPKADSDNGPADAMEMLRRHFESQFAPLPEVKGAAGKGARKGGVKGSKSAKKARTEVVEEEDDDESGSEWEGLEEEEEEDKKKHTGSFPSLSRVYIYTIYIHSTNPPHRQRQHHK